jgi:hypothetical protein
MRTVGSRLNHDDLAVRDKERPACTLALESAMVDTPRERLDVKDDDTQPVPQSAVGRWFGYVRRAFKYSWDMDPEDKEARHGLARVGRYLSDVFGESRRDLLGWAARYSSVQVIPQGERLSVPRPLVGYPAAVCALIVVWIVLGSVYVVWMAFTLLGMGGDE